MDANVLDSSHEDFPGLPAAAVVAIRESFAPATVLARRADWRVWRAWCLGQSPPARVFPAEPEALRQFIADQSPPLVVGAGGIASVSSETADGRPRVKRAVTLARYLSTLSTLHRLANAPDPTRDPRVRSARRLYTRGRGASTQRAPVGLALVRDVSAALGESLADLRARALLFTAHSTLARRAELVRLTVEDLASTPAGDGVALLRRTKGDAEGVGSERYLSAEAVAALRAWVAAAAIDTGPVFRRLHRGGLVGSKAVSAHEVARIVKSTTARYAATLPEAERRRLPLGRLSAHSTRIGAAQDLVASGADLLAVMNAGGWKDTKMPALYTRRLSALRGGMARLYGREMDSLAAMHTLAQLEKL